MSEIKPKDTVTGFPGTAQTGLTKLEYFAVMAMQGLLANSYNHEMIQPLSQTSRHEIADMAVDQAGALIARLNKGY